MLARIYKKNIIEKPKFLFFIFILAALVFSFYSKDFRLDASSETLLIEEDPDLKYLKEVNKMKIISKNFLLNNLKFFIWNYFLYIFFWCWKFNFI